MALTESSSISLGTKMPDFILRDAGGNSYSSHDLFGKKGLLVIFTCNHCPYANAVWEDVISIAEKNKQAINTIAINPNINPDYPEDSPENMKKKIQELKINFPYLIDTRQDVARAFKAQCTPDIYLFNSEKTLVYHGRINELPETIRNIISGREISQEQKPSIGCSIKWLE